MVYPNLYLIGLTGNIACGKSSVVAILRELGAHTLDADQVTRRLQEPGTPVYERIVALFSPAVATAPNGPLDRRALGAIVFSDPVALAQLEAIVHPAVHDAIEEWLAEVAQHAPSPTVAVIDAIKLLERGWKDVCDAVWVVTSTPEQQAARLIQERGLSEAEAWQRINAQPPQAEKIAQADVVIDNSGTREHTRAQVVNIWQRIS